VIGIFRPFPGVERGKSLPDDCFEFAMVRGRFLPGTRRRPAALGVRNTLQADGAEALGLFRNQSFDIVEDLADGSNPLDSRISMVLSNVSRDHGSHIFGGMRPGILSDHGFAGDTTILAADIILEPVGQFPAS
jgi:hypothetical protein